MNNRERIVIYGALALLGGVNLAALFGPAGSYAAADPVTPGEALGPADTLTLVEGEKQLVLHNRGERLAWSDSDHARAFAIGFVHVGRAVGPLLEADQYTEELSQLGQELQKLDDELTQRIDAFLEEHRDVAPDDPRAADLQRTFQEMRQELERTRVEGSARVGKLQADQTERAYRDLVAAVEVVAQRRNVDIVFRFIPTANEFGAPNLGAAYTAIRARLALKYPEGLDITEEVLEELALDS